jgi:hypothetical protein
MLTVHVRITNILEGGKQMKKNWKKVLAVFAISAVLVIGGIITLNTGGDPTDPFGTITFTQFLK